MENSLVELFRHNLWANLRLIDHVAVLNPDLLEATVQGTFGAVGATLKHIVANEEGYLLHMGNPVTEHLLFHEYGVLDLTDLRQRAQATGDGLIALAEALIPDGAIRGTFQGQPYVMPSVVPLMQAINHGTEHRAHVITTLSQQGVPALSLDVWTYWESLPK